MLLREGDRFAAQLDPAYEAWRQMLSPPSYGLDADAELRHVTWCPDPRCAVGRRGWATHLRYLEVIGYHFSGKNGPQRQAGTYPVWRAIDVNLGPPEGRDVAYTFRGLRFLPLEESLRREGSDPWLPW
ncbi:hypothetical protein PG997_000139 [Apiospora hydei]|uniref:Uncharacterized protein n=1 Tax=Apiospora hydei TaxID=1337664 RepID=A0ABR1XA34_9PEZI